VNLITNKLVKLLGKLENTERFLALSLYQGKTRGDAGVGTLKPNAKGDPLLFCTAFKKQRFYVFSRREPVEAESAEQGRDVFNEKPTEEKIATQTLAPLLPTNAVLHTTKGDIHIKLFGEECPKTVENFTTHSRNGYYNGLIFHRVIDGFMIQTGDPNGDGTGGNSIWGTDFEDEFNKNLKHDRPGTVSMANLAKPNTNRSQFFITTLSINRLDGKHSVFGRVTKGMEVVHAIERVKTDEDDKPVDDIKVISISLSTE